jgi:hypothetical protein
LALMGRPRFLAVIGLTVGASLAGCAAEPVVVYSVVNQPPRAFVRRAPADVDVVLGKSPLRAHLDVGLFEVYQGQRPDGQSQTTQDMLDELREHAALRGCDAVQVLGVELFGKMNVRVVRGACEMYIDEASLRAAAKPAPALPGEGQRCPIEVGPHGDVVRCPRLLVCRADLCVSPYPN